MSCRIVAKFKTLWRKRYASVYSADGPVTGVAALNRQKIRLALTLYYKQANCLNESINGLYNQKNRKSVGMKAIIRFKEKIERDKKDQVGL